VSASTLRIKAGLVAITAAVVHLLADKFYRPAIYANDSFDFGLADGFTQITAIVGISSVIIFWESSPRSSNPFSPKSLAGFAVIVAPFSMLVYECLQLWYPFAVFDTRDLGYCLIGGILNFFVVNKILLSDV
jgi:hypothetical protein